MGFSLKNTIS